MEIKDQSGNVIGVLELKEGYNIKDIVGAVSSSKKVKSSFKDLVSIEENSNKKQLIFKFSDGEIFYNLPSKTFVRSNGTKIGENSFRSIKLNLNNKLERISGGWWNVDNFWLTLAEKTTTPWIKTFFKMIDIWANKKHDKYHLGTKERIRNNKIQRLIVNKKLLDCIESFAKINQVQSMTEDQLCNLYFSLASVGDGNDIDVKANDVLDKWYINNINKQISKNYVENDVSLEKYVGAYRECSFNNLKEVFQYCFETYGGVIQSKHVPSIFGLISWGYEPKRLIDYLYRDIYNQGLEISFHNWIGDCAAGMLYDYVKMNIDMKTEYEKYPRYLSTFHDITQKNYELNEDKIIKEKFNGVVKHLNKFKFSFGDFTIVLPTSGQDLVKEGQRLNHCVASYYKRMADGETKIVFLRNKKELDKSLVTIEINDKNNIVQAKGVNNSAPKEQEKEFIRKYGEFLISKKEKIK